MLAPMDHVAHFLELCGTRFLTEREVRNKERNVFRNTHFVHKFLGTVSQIMRLEWEVLLRKEPAYISTKVRQMPKHTVAAVFIPENMHRVLPKALDEPLHAAHFHKTTEIWLHLVHELIDCRKHARNHAPWRIDVP